MIGEQREVALCRGFQRCWPRAIRCRGVAEVAAAWAASAMAQALAAVLMVSVISVSLESIRLRRIGRNANFGCEFRNCSGACRRRAW